MKRILTLITFVPLVTFPLSALPRSNDKPSPPPASLVPKKDKRSSCAPCAAAQANSNNKLDSLATLGRRTQPMPFMPIARSAFDGATVNFVSTATGALSFAVTDLELPGTLPIMFQRIYASDSREDFGLGAGWYFVFDDRIAVDSNNAMMRTGNASTLAFRRDGQSNHFVLQTPAPSPHQSFDLSDDGNSITEQIGNLTRAYAKLNNVYRLTQIADANGNTININFDTQGRIVRIANSSGSSLALQWSNDKNARLVSVTDHANRRVSFDQDAKRLRSVTDATGAKWSYDYQNDQLTRALDPTGRLLLRARYDATGRAIEAGDAIGSYKYKYEYANASGISTRTTVTDPLGAQTTYEHTAQGAVSIVSDDEGNSARIEYNAANRPQRMSDSSGNEVRFAYDAANRLQSQTSSDGTNKSYAYDERGRLVSKIENGARTDYTLDARGNIIVAESDNPKRNYHANYDSHGQMETIEFDTGTKLIFEHDAAGNETAFATAKSGRFEIERDSLGNAVTRRLPSGATYHYEYDARRKVTKQSDNQGRVVTFERDASGAITGIVMANGVWVRATRDEAGRITELKNSAGKMRHFGYDARGALTDYTDAQGNSKRFDYDSKGLLTRITDSDGRKTVIQRDKHGKRVGILVTDKRGIRYEYDASGNLLAVRRNTPSVRFEKANFTFASATVQDPSCLFQGDGWFPNDTFYADFGMDCSDSFGGFGDDSSIDFLGLGDSGSACTKCMVRVAVQCELQNLDCLGTRALGPGVSAAALCFTLANAGIITSATSLEAAALCGTVAFVLSGLGCNFEAWSCLVREGANCPCDF